MSKGQNWAEVRPESWQEAESEFVVWFGADP